MSLNLGTILRNSANKYPEKAALVIGKTSVSYAQLHGMAQKVAAALDALGVGERAHVALMLPNVPYFTGAYYGALYRGSPVVPLNVLLKSGEVEYHLRDSDAEVLIVWESFLSEGQAGFDKVPTCKHLIVVPQDPTSTAPFEGGGARNFHVWLSKVQPRQEMTPTSPNDTAVILYTSGTTGRPKGAELSHFNLFQNAQYTSTNLIPMKADFHMLAVLPLFHSFCQTVVQNCGLSVGATIVLMPRFDAEQALQIMQEHAISMFAGVPTMYFALLHHPKANEYHLDSLKYCVCGGSSMPEQVMAEFDQKYNVNILEGYGLSETSPVASFNVLDRPKKVGSIGIPIDYCEFRLVDESGKIVVDTDTPGEICIKGVNVMKGYYKAPEATSQVMTENGWFATGDIATCDEDGYYRIVDRKKDMIIRGGYNVYPREVEEVLYQHEAIAEAAVIGISDKKYGEEIKAVVVLRPDKEASPDELIEFCKTRVAAYKYPRMVAIVDSLPKSATGKILKRELRAHES